MGIGNIEIRVFPPISVAAVKHVGSYFECGSAFKTLLAWAIENKLPLDNATVLGIPFDDPKSVPESDLRYLACMTIEPGTEVSGEITKEEIEGGRYACVMVEGPYEQLAEAYAYLHGEWLPQSGEKLRHAPPVEVYHNSPEDTPPEKLLTELRLPLA